MVGECRNVRRLLRTSAVVTIMVAGAGGGSSLLKSLCSDNKALITFHVLSVQARACFGDGMACAPLFGDISMMPMTALIAIAFRTLIIER